MLETTQTEFEIQPESSDENENEYKTVDSVFDFKELEPFLNLQRLDDVNEDNVSFAVPFDKLRNKMKNVTPDGKVMKLVSKL